MLKYTKEYAKDNFDCEINFIHNLLLNSECMRLGFEDTKDALIKSGYVKPLVEKIIDNSYDCKDKLLKTGLKINKKWLNLDQEIVYAQEGLFDYMFLMRVYYHKWRKLMFKFFNDTYVSEITERKQNKVRCDL